MLKHRSLIAAYLFPSREMVADITMPSCGIGRYLERRGQSCRVLSREMSGDPDGPSKTCPHRRLGDDGPLFVVAAE